MSCERRSPASGAAPRGAAFSRRGGARPAERGRFERYAFCLCFLPFFFLPCAFQEAFAEAQAELQAADPSAEVVERDALAEKCGQESQLALSFQLPSGIWVATSSINLCKKTYEVEEGQPPPPVVLKESLKLKALRQETGEPLSFDFRFEEDLSGLRALRQWLQRGLQLKLHYLPKPKEKEAPIAEEQAAEPAEAGEAAVTEEAAETEAQRPKEAASVCLGGCVLPLSSFLQRTPSGGEWSSGCPDPWPHAAEVAVVPVARWLDPGDPSSQRKGGEQGEGEGPAGCGFGALRAAGAGAQLVLHALGGCRGV